MTEHLKSPPSRVLLVDDEHINIQILSEALSGFDLSFATDGARALELAIQKPFDLILLDVVMPGIGGPEVLRWLKSEPRTEHIPVIFVTAMSEFEDEARGLALGAVDYITKPIRPAIVRARVRTHIELKRQRDLLTACLPLDPRTGIANRRHFEQELARAWRRSKRNGLPMTLMLVEIDYFDRYVENFGLSPGDECLTCIANALDESMRRSDDLAAYYGAEQFALLIEASDGANQIRRVLEVVRALEILHPRSECSVFVSISLGAVTLNANDDGSPTAALAQAESLLQSAKQAGRNRGAFHDLITDTRSTVLPGEPQVTLESEA